MFIKTNIETTRYRKALSVHTPAIIKVGNCACTELLLRISGGIAAPYRKQVQTHSPPLYIRIYTALHCNHVWTYDARRCCQAYAHSYRCLYPPVPCSPSFCSFGACMMCRLPSSLLSICCMKGSINLALKRPLCVDRKYDWPGSTRPHQARAPLAWCAVPSMQRWRSFKRQRKSGLSCLAMQKRCVGGGGEVVLGVPRV